MIEARPAAIPPGPCPRCNGRMMTEEYLGETEFVCLQCGNRVDAPEFRRRAYSIVTTKAA